MRALEIDARVVTFSGTHEAFAFEDAARADALPGRLVPLPAAISAGCGLAWKTPPDAPGLARFLETATVGYEEVYRYDADRAYHRVEGL